MSEVNKNDQKHDDSQNSEVKDSKTQASETKQGLAVQNQIKKTQANHDEESSLWKIPTVEDPNVDEEKINAIGKKAQWRYEPPEEVEAEDPVPLTAQEIEDIRQAAFDEGFNQGKEQGFAKGYEEGKAQGHEEGLKKGTEQGIADGFEQGKEQIDNLAKQWEVIIHDLKAPLEKVEKNVEEQLLQLLVLLVEAVTLQECKTNPDILLAAIDKGIKALPLQESSTQIYLNPIDIKLVEAQFGEQYMADQGWRLLPAPHVDVGSCQIENSTSNIDLTVKSKLKEVLDSFLQEALHQ